MWRIEGGRESPGSRNTWSAAEVMGGSLYVLQGLINKKLRTARRWSKETWWVVGSLDGVL